MADIIQFSIIEGVMIIDHFQDIIQTFLNISD